MDRDSRRRKREKERLLDELLKQRAAASKPPDEEFNANVAPHQPTPSGSSQPTLPPSILQKHVRFSSDPDTHHEYSLEDPVPSSDRIEVTPGSSRDPRDMGSLLNAETRQRNVGVSVDERADGGVPRPSTAQDAVFVAPGASISWFKHQVYNHYYEGGSSSGSSSSSSNRSGRHGEREDSRDIRRKPWRWTWARACVLARRGCWLFRLIVMLGVAALALGLVLNLWPIVKTIVWMLLAWPLAPTRWLAGSGGTSSSSSSSYSSGFAHDPLQPIRNPTSQQAIRAAPILADVASITGVLDKTESGLHALGELGLQLQTVLDMGSVLQDLTTAEESINQAWEVRLRGELRTAREVASRLNDIKQTAEREAAGRLGILGWGSKLICAFPKMRGATRSCRASEEALAKLADDMLGFLTEIQNHRRVYITNKSVSTTARKLSLGTCKQVDLVGNVHTDVMGLRLNVLAREKDKVRTDGDGEQQSREDRDSAHGVPSTTTGEMLLRAQDYLQDQREGLQMSCNIARAASVDVDLVFKAMEEDMDEVDDMLLVVNQARQAVNGKRGSAVPRTIQRMEGSWWRW
ncbi:hypothetical protein Ct61P_15455 [Colletotrichum tofieldiae]|nr:hypothetical protein Ct61P_15455 [Colletotrichum tofieldiae]